MLVLLFVSRSSRRITQHSTKRFGSIRMVRGDRLLRPPLSPTIAPLSLQLVRWWKTALSGRSLPTWVVRKAAGVVNPSRNIMVVSLLLEQRSMA